MGPYHYVGSELDLFRNAHHWRRYWIHQVAHLITGDVLEVGAGIGSATTILGPFARSWTALEPDPRLLARVPERYTRICGTLNTLPTVSRYDAILYVDVLEHINNDKRETENAYQLLKPGGILIILSPAHQWLYSNFDHAIGHFRRYSRQTLNAIRPKGSVTLTMRYLDSAGLVVSAANRVLLQAKMPTAAQIRFWDCWLIPCSRLLDPMLNYRLGKSILVIWQKPLPAPPAPAQALPDPYR